MACSERDLIDQTGPSAITDFPKTHLSAIEDTLE
jgi:hypothetical protein